MIFQLESKAFAMNKAMNKAVVIKNFETFEKYPTRMGTPLCQVDFYTLYSLYVKFAKIIWQSCIGNSFHASVNKIKSFERRLYVKRY